MSEYDFTGGTVTMKIEFESFSKMVEMLEKLGEDELFTLGYEFEIYKDGRAAIYKCVSVSDT